MTTYSATVRRDANTTLGKGAAGQLVCFGARTIELGAVASGSIIDFKLNIPSNARLAGCSRLYHDDLATSGSPTIDLGLYAVNGNITSDDDALNDGIVVSAVMTSSTQTIGVPVVKDFANLGKAAYLFVNGQTTDPSGELAVKGIVRDAATNSAGTITLELYGYLD
jgi:hypothetical protein